MVLEDDELLHRPFGAQQLRPLCDSLKEAALSLDWSRHERHRHRPAPAAAAAASSSSSAAAAAAADAAPAALQGSLLRLLRQLYERDTRRPFMSGPHAWLADASRQSAVEALALRLPPAVLDLEPADLHSLAGAASSPTNLPFGGAPFGGGGAGGLAAGVLELPETRRVIALLQQMPFTVAFEARLRLVRRWLAQERQGLLEQQLLMHGDVAADVITVRREHLLDDAFEELRGASMRSTLRVQFIGLEGLEEAGVGEGVAKEFIVDVLRAGFEPSAGLFCAGDDGALFPDPAALVRVPDALAKFEWLGAVLGKALFEGILVELPLARAFLNQLLGRSNSLSEMPALDPTLYRSLMALRAHDGDFDALCLSFAVPQFVYGDQPVPPHLQRTVNLKPGGADLAVTRANRVEYIYLVAHYRLNLQLRRPSEAFLRGLSSVVPRRWLALFSAAELQLLLGGSDAPLDVDDWQAHAVYAGGYHPDHPVVTAFWATLRGFSPDQRAATLKFVTSCSRPPLLGFAHLQPAFCIYRATAEEGRLPTSATCMNLLKLPPYDSEEMLRGKLEYAISAGAGFELS